MAPDCGPDLASVGAERGLGETGTTIRITSVPQWPVIGVVKTPNTTYFDDVTLS